MQGYAVTHSFSQWAGECPCLADHLWRLSLESSLHLRSVEQRYGRLKFYPILKSLGNLPQ